MFSGTPNLFVTLFLILYSMEIHVKYLQACMLHITAFVKKAGFDIPEHFLFPDGDKTDFSTRKAIKLTFLFFNGFRRMRTFWLNFKHYSVFKKPCTLLRWSFSNFIITGFFKYCCCSITACSICCYFQLCLLNKSQWCKFEDNPWSKTVMSNDIFHFCHLFIVLSVVQII